MHVNRHHRWLTLMLVGAAGACGLPEGEGLVASGSSDVEVVRAAVIPATCKTNCTINCQEAIRQEMMAKASAVGLGAPTSGFGLLAECGHFAHFASGSVYFHPDAGVHAIYGQIYELWAWLGWETSFLKYPTTDELGTPDGRGRYNHFQGGSIYWTPTTGAHEVHGSIKSKWSALGSESSLLGYPTTNQTTTPDGVGQFNHFEHGSIYWSPDEGAHEIHGAIRDRWEALGWEQSWLGYPKTDEVEYGGTLYNWFQNGYIFYDGSWGAKEAKYWFAGRYVYLTSGNIGNNLSRMITINNGAISRGTVDSFRTNVIKIGLAEVSAGWSGDAARARYGASGAWCSEFARWVYRQAGMDMYVCRTRVLGICLNPLHLSEVKTIDDFRDLFRDDSQWLVSADGQVGASTIEPGDYLALTTNAGEKKHSAIAVAVTPNKSHVLIMEGNAGDAVNFRAIRYMNGGAVDGEIDAVGKIKASLF